MAKLTLITMDPVTRDTLRDAFKKAGHQVHATSHDLELLEQAILKETDAAIIDICYMDGPSMETLILYQQERPDIMLIALSSQEEITTQMYLDMAERMGALATFAPPIEPELIVTTLEKILENSQANHDAA